MALTYAKLANPVLLGTADTLITSIAAGKTAQLRSMLLVNTSGSAVSCRVYLVPSGSLVGTGNILIPDVAVGAKDIWGWPDNLDAVLNSGDSVYASAATANVVVLHLSGWLM